MVEFSIQTIGTERFVRGFSGIAQEVQDFEEPFRVIQGDFQATEQRIFATEGASEGEPFKPLSKNYREWKEIFFPGQPIMVLFGDLAQSLMGRTGATIERIDRTSAEFGTSVPHAHRHQMGTDGMPQRKVIQINEETKKRWGHIFARWIHGKFEKYGITGYTSYSEAIGSAFKNW